LLGVGVVIIQPATAKIVVVSDERGRKDKNESLEQAALREGYEEVHISQHLLCALLTTR
jgi:hypothetical protein